MIYARETQVAAEAVSQAARLCDAVRADMTQTMWIEKADRSPVTIADFGVQALVCRQLTAAFPYDPIVAEEDVADLRKAENQAIFDHVTRYVQQFQADATHEAISTWIDTGGQTVAERYWTLDPIDGTKGFLRNDQYAIALALVVEGDVKVGVLACPALPLDTNDSQSERGVLFVATRSQGAYMMPLSGGLSVPIHVTDRFNAAGLRFVESVEAGHGNQDLQMKIAQAAGITQRALRIDSQAKYGVVARGEAALYLRLPSPRSPGYCEKIWDHAAGALVIEEAGGRVTDMLGKPLDFATSSRMCNNRGVVASNGAIHESVIAALTEYMSLMAEPAHGD